MPETIGRFEVTNSFVDVDLGEAKDHSALAAAALIDLSTSRPNTTAQARPSTAAKATSFAIKITNERGETRDCNIAKNPADAGRSWAEAHAQKLSPTPRSR